MPTWWSSGPWPQQGQTWGLAVRLQETAGQDLGRAPAGSSLASVVMGLCRVGGFQALRSLWVCGQGLPITPHPGPPSGLPRPPGDGGLWDTPRLQDMTGQLVLTKHAAHSLLSSSAVTGPSGVGGELNWSQESLPSS